MLPKALVIGCSIHEFWYEDPWILDAYAKAYELSLKDKVEEWKMKINFTAWLQGAYIQSAVASVLSKDAHYPKKPFELFSEEISEEQRQKESEDAIRMRSQQIDEMLAKKQKAPNSVFSENIE